MPNSLTGAFLLAAGTLAMDAFVFGTLGLDNFSGWFDNTPHIH